jgi:hypothetical protein
LGLFDRAMVLKVFLTGPLAPAACFWNSEGFGVLAPRADVLSDELCKVSHGDTCALFAWQIPLVFPWLALVPSQARAICLSILGHSCCGVSTLQAFNEIRDAAGRVAVVTAVASVCGTIVHNHAF